jgi:hypothetical protein
MEDATTFSPPRQRGYLFHAGALGLLGSIVALLLNQAAQAPLGPVFLLYLLAAILLALPLPLLAYRLYALRRSEYVLFRDGVALRWGLREEVIPMAEIAWVRRADDLVKPLVPPGLRWPGSVVGVSEHEDAGSVEFMAAEEANLILIGVAERVFAISPVEHEAFVSAYQEKFELGTLAPPERRSVYPAFLLTEILSAPAPRALVLAGAALNLALLVWVSLEAPGRQTISLGLDPSGAALPPVAAAQLFLLPVVSIFFLLANFVLSLYFFQREDGQAFAHILWGASILTAVLFLIAVYAILLRG